MTPDNPAVIDFRTLGPVGLRGENGVELRAILVQPRRVAILLYLAMHQRNELSTRNSIIGVFWPESNEERARGSLRTALRNLRGLLGEETFIGHGDERIGIDPDQPSVVFVGRITRQKGVALLLEAAKAFEPSAQLVLCAGSADTPELDRLDPVEPADEDLRLSTAVGTPEEVLARLLPLVRAFGDRDLQLVVRLHYPGMDLETAARAVELFAAEVTPTLKSG